MKLLSSLFFIIALSFASWPLAADPPSTSTLPLAKQLIAAARRQVDDHVIYWETYDVIPYPNGDVNPRYGVCADLVIRAFRKVGVDLQREIQEDRVAHPEAYPTKLWDAKKPDKNIDHRRCPNLAAWFKRHATLLTKSVKPEDLSAWQPGDIVFFVKPGQDFPWHVALISDRKTKSGMPLLIDNYPPITRESHRLDEFGPIHSHFRFIQPPKSRHDN